MEIRRLGPGDEDIVRVLATREPHTELLQDERTIFLVAFDGDEPRHDPPTKLLVYEVDVAEAHRGRGVGKALLAELALIARNRGIRHGWVLTDRGNEAAMALYLSAGGLNPHEETMWEFDYAGP